MENVASGAIEMTWDPNSRIAFISFKEETRATGKDAQVLVSALTQWIGGQRIPFALMGDGGKLSGVDADYRREWGNFFLQHRDDSYITFFNMNPIIRIAAGMFGLGTGLRLKPFATEAEARAWLRQKGIGA
ncbi:MAG: hypothetical protein ACRDFQ_05355 [Anaerolineales bacterium]